MYYAGELLSTAPKSPDRCFAWLPRSTGVPASQLRGCTERMLSDLGERMPIGAADTLPSPLIDSFATTEISNRRGVNYTLDMYVP